MDMRAKLFLLISLIVLMLGASFSFASAPKAKPTASKSVIGKATAIKTAYLNGCRELHFDQNPLDGGMLSTYQPFSVLTPIDIRAGVVTMPFFLTSKSGQFPTETSQIWDIEFFDAVPPSGYYPNPDSANQNADEFFDGTPAAWPNKNHPSLVARSTKQTPDVPDAHNGPGSYVALTGDLGSVTLSRDVHYVRARLRADIYPDMTHNSVRARTVQFCAGPPTVSPSCITVDLGQNGVTPAWDGSEGFTDGILRYSSNSSRNAPYSNTANVNLPAGKVTIPNIYTFDENNNRENETQDSERVALEFLDSSNAVIATSSISPDLSDNVGSAYFEGDLDEVNLSRPATGVRAKHMPDATSSQNTSDALNVPGATLCYQGTPPPIDTIEANPNVTIDIVTAPTTLYEEQTGSFSYRIVNTGNIALKDLQFRTNTGITIDIPDMAVGEVFNGTFFVTIPLGVALPPDRTAKLIAFVYNPRLTIDTSKYHWPPRFATPDTQPIFFQRTTDRDILIERIVLPT